MNRFILFLLLGFASVSCFNETGYDTAYVLRVHEQVESSGDYTSLAMTKAYAFAGTTDEWEFLSYDDAEAGVITLIETGEQKGPFSWSEAYQGDDTQLLLQLDREEVVLVVVEPTTLSYAYTDYTVPVNVPEIIVDIVFRTWRTESYTASTWTFILPEVESESDEDTDTDDTDTDADDTDTDTDTEDTDTDADTDESELTDTEL